MAFSANGKLLLTGSEDMTARVWDSATGHQYRQFKDHPSEVFTVTFTPDGRYAVVGSHTSAYLWDIEKERLIRKFDGHKSGIRSVDVSADGQFLLTGSNDHSAWLWDIENGQMSQQYLGHTDDVLFASFAADGKMVFTGSQDGSLRVWNRHNGKQLNIVTNLDNTFNTMAFSTQQQVLYTASGHNIQVWDVINAKLGYWAPTIQPRGLF